MNTAFDFAAGTWKIAWPGRIAQHDLVYHSVFDDPMRGIPLGNGDIGVLCWCDNTKIILVINKCDLWEDSNVPETRLWSGKDSESNTTLRHGARIIMDFLKPVFDPVYVSDFTGRLSLADAKMSIVLDGPFGKLSIDAFVDKTSGMLLGKVASSFTEQNEITVTLERFGSRTFPYWYRMLDKDCAKGLSGTQTFVDADAVYLTHKLNTGTFAVALKTSNLRQCVSETRRLHSNAAQIRVLPEGNCSFQFQSMVTSPTATGDPLPRLLEEHTLADNFTNILRGHRRLWKDFWLRSMMDFGDDYLENLWYLNMYYANCSQSGSSPGRFINGLWHWNRDIQPWNFYYHWNQQQTYWPLSAAGHHDLVKSYLDFRFRHLDKAKETARDWFGASGAFVSDVVDRRGYNAHIPHNHTPVAEIALDFWRQYEFTMDMDFLRDEALPYMIEAAKFMVSRFKKGNDGKYHARPGTGYEGWILLKDCVTELSSAGSLFKATLNAMEILGVENPIASAIRSILNGMVALQAVPDSGELIRKTSGEYVYTVGPHKGKTVDNNLLLSVGIPYRHNRLGSQPISGLLSRDEPSELAGDDIYDVIQRTEAGWEPSIIDGRETAYIEGIFPMCESSAVFPSNWIGLDDKDGELYKAAVNTFRLWGKEFWGGEPFPTVLARLGLREELHACLREYPRRWQWYSNGWGHYGGSQRKIESSIRHSTFPGVWNVELDSVDRVKPENTMEIPRAPFRHMGFEGMSNLCCAMNETLLQSHNGVIRIAPAIHEKQNARFTLHARGGFIVSGQSVAGKLKWVHIRCRSAGHCIIRNPWTRCSLFVNGKYRKTVNAEKIECDVSKNQQLVLLPGMKKMLKYAVIREKNMANDSRKTGPCGLEFLGL